MDADQRPAAGKIRRQLKLGKADGFCAPASAHYAFTSTHRAPLARSKFQRRTSLRVFDQKRVSGRLNAIRAAELWQINA
jgi:hypothetical protein